MHAYLFAEVLGHIGFEHLEQLLGIHHWIALEDALALALLDLLRSGLLHFVVSHMSVYSILMNDLLSIINQVGFWGFGVLGFWVGFHGCSRWLHGFSWFWVGFHGFSRWFHGF